MSVIVTNDKVKKVRKSQMLNDLRSTRLIFEVFICDISSCTGGTVFEYHWEQYLLAFY